MFNKNFPRLLEQEQIVNVHLENEATELINEKLYVSVLLLSKDYTFGIETTH